MERRGELRIWEGVVVVVVVGVASVAPSVDSWALRKEHLSHLLCMHIELNMAKVYYNLESQYIKVAIVKNIKMYIDACQK